MTRNYRVISIDYWLSWKKEKMDKFRINPAQCFPLVRFRHHNKPAKNPELHSFFFFFYKNKKKTLTTPSKNRVSNSYSRAKRLRSLIPRRPFAEV